MDLKKRPSKRQKRKYIAMIILLSLILIACIFYWAVSYVPAEYTPPTIKTHDQLSTYITNQLAPEFYNKYQQKKPFEIILTQDAANEIIAHSQWPLQYGKTIINTPTVVFEPKRILLMSKVKLSVLPVIITFDLSPKITPDGMLRLGLNSIKAGKLNITGYALGITSQIAENNPKLAENPDTINIINAITKDQPLEPKFTINKNDLIIKDFDLAKNQITLTFTPQ